MTCFIGILLWPLIAIIFFCIMFFILFILPEYLCPEMGPPYLPRSCYKSIKLFGRNELKDEYKNSSKIILPKE